MGRPPEHDASTAEALLDAGEELLAGVGPDGVSVRAVAAAAGTSTRAVYALFDGKPGLIAALAARGYDLLTERVDGIAPSGDAAADLVAVGLDGFRPFAVEHPSLFRLTFERLTVDVTHDPVVGRAALASYESLARWVQRAQEAGVVRADPVEHVAFTFHSLCQGLAGSELSRQPPPVGANFWRNLRGGDMPALWRAALEAFVAGLAPVEPVRPRR